MVNIMTQEEKAKAYDNALKIARKNYDAAQDLYSGSQIGVECFKNTLTNIFPELKESEDEKIRKELITWLQNTEGQVLPIDRYNAALAWLEKQGNESINIDIESMVSSYEQRVVSQCNGVKNNPFVNMCVSAFRHGIENTLEELNLKKLEKQDEQKPNYTTLVKTGNGGINALVTEEVSVNSCDYDEKPANKIEPKFKVGDWIVSKTSNLVYRVDSILLPQSKCYYLSHNGSIVLVNFGDKENYRLWTVADAKDGDILATKDAVFIFKHKDKTGLSLCKSYCEIIGNSKLGFGFDFSINGVYPATKEQRATLEKAMADAGWEFDFEKKELKKIEQMHIECNDADELSCFESALFTAFSYAWQSYLMGEEVDVKQWTKEQSKELLEAAKEDLKEHNLAWSEDDRTNVQRICRYLKEIKKYYADINEVRECIDWLKSLKDKVGCEANCTTTKEWSEEDEHTLQGVIDEIQANKNQAPDYDLETYDRFLAWLKSLKNKVAPQKQWKPSEEQMNALDSTLQYSKVSNNSREHLNSLYNDLKKLRE